MKYLLDTCVISEMVKPSPDKKLIRWVENEPSTSLFLSVITIGEIRKGLSKLPASRKKEKLTIWLNMLLEEYSDRILAIDLTVAENWGEMQGRAEKEGVVMPSIDGLIAAITYTNNMILVTRNETDFISANIPVINPWKL
ncbi:MAG TPA: type II toxin-antitoxin system VapC family toxin [Spirochaetota bacterium]|nr:type II toxin-antitoxin system VapC family toxin [Spirochaetota bacterium]HPQ53622.1 type II toxin-antitoxin system VapC family toxin [Spirochaetota bacterium]